MQIDLNEPQCAFLELPHKYRALVTGFGGGKTWVGCVGLMRHFLEHPNVTAGYFAPTFSQVKTVFAPTLDEVAEQFGANTRYLAADRTMIVKFGRKERGRIICRSMDNPDSIVGFKIGHALVDELDTMPTDKARRAWRKIIARMRIKAPNLRNGIDVTTTPEGFRFVYQQWVVEAKKSDDVKRLYGMVQASTYDNELNLPEGYIDGLLATYPISLIGAYLNGEFVNLASGSVYPMFDRIKNASKEAIRQDDILHIGMDFNVGNMAASVHVLRDDKPHAVDEIVGQLDTPTVIKSVKRRWPSHRVFVYPDASGGNRKSQDASQSDLSLLRQAGFHILNNPSNPAVRDRVLSVCKLLEAGDYKINLDKCPSLVDSLEKQAYDKNGAPDKSAGLDHIIDAAGYFIAHRYPIRAGRAAHQKLLGF